mgnify:CR=1 FL=1
MPDNEAPTIEQLEEVLAEERATFDKRNKAQSQARKAFEAVNDGQHEIMLVVEAATELRDAQANVQNSEARIGKAQKAIDNFAFTVKAGERNELIASYTEWVRNADETDRMLEVGLTKLVFTVEFADGETDPKAFTVQAKPSGPGLTAYRAPRTASGGGNGFKSAGAVLVDGTEYRSLNAAYMVLRAAEDGVQASDVTPANSESVNRWLKKQGHTVESAAPTT